MVDIVSLQSAFCTVQTEMQGNSDIWEIKNHVYGTRHFVPRDQVFP